MKAEAKKRYDYEEFKGNPAMLRYGMVPGNENDFDEGEDTNRKGLLSISEMSKYARITRSALIFYDNMGLVSPVERGNNNYRYYSPYQVTTTNLVNTLQELAIPLKEIVRLASGRTPEKMKDLLAEQSRYISRQIESFLRSQKLLMTLTDMIDDGLSADENKIDVRWHEEEAILTGPQIDYSNGLTIEEALYNFYQHCSDNDSDLDLNYPVWGFFSEESVKRREWSKPDRFYFKMPGAPDKKEAGLYATGYSRGYYGHNDSLFKRLTAYIEENGLEICGPSYETYPLNEISITNPYNYLMRVSIRVEKL